MSNQASLLDHLILEHDDLQDKKPRMSSPISISEVSSLSGTEIDIDQNVCKQAKRKIANANEKRRMESINAGYDELRKMIPTADAHKLPKAKVLLIASDYIRKLSQENQYLKQSLANCGISVSFSAESIGGGTSAVTGLISNDLEFEDPAELTISKKHAINRATSLTDRDVVIQRQQVEIESLKRALNNERTEFRNLVSPVKNPPPLPTSSGRRSLTNASAYFASDSGSVSRSTNGTPIKNTARRSSSNQQSKNSSDGGFGSSQSVSNGRGGGRKPRSSRKLIISPGGADPSKHQQIFEMISSPCCDENSRGSNISFSPAASSTADPFSPISTGSGGGGGGSAAFGPSNFPTLGDNVSVGRGVNTCQAVYSAAAIADSDSMERQNATAILQRLSASCGTSPIDFKPLRQILPSEGVTPPSIASGRGRSGGRDPPATNISPLLEGEEASVKMKQQLMQQERYTTSYNANVRDDGSAHPLQRPPSMSTLTAVTSSATVLSVPVAGSSSVHLAPPLPPPSSVVSSPPPLLLQQQQQPLPPHLQQQSPTQLVAKPDPLNINNSGGRILATPTGLVISPISAAKMADNCLGAASITSDLSTTSAATRPVVGADNGSSTVFTTPAHRGSTSSVATARSSSYLRSPPLPLPHTVAAAAAGLSTISAPSTLAASSSSSVHNLQQYSYVIAPSTVSSSSSNGTSSSSGGMAILDPDAADTINRSATGGAQADPAPSRYSSSLAQLSRVQTVQVQANIPAGAFTANGESSNHNHSSNSSSSQLIAGGHHVTMRRHHSFDINYTSTSTPIHSSSSTNAIQDLTSLPSDISAANSTGFSTASTNRLTQTQCSSTMPGNKSRPPSFSPTRSSYRHMQMLDSIRKQHAAEEDNFADTELERIHREEEEDQRRLENNSLHGSKSTLELSAIIKQEEEFTSGYDMERSRHPPVTSMRSTSGLEPSVFFRNSNINRHQQQQQEQHLHVQQIAQQPQNSVQQHYSTFHQSHQQQQQQQSQGTVSLGAFTSNFTPMTGATGLRRNFRSLSSMGDTISSTHKYLVGPPPHFQSFDKFQSPYEISSSSNSRRSLAINTGRVGADNRVRDATLASAACPINDDDLFMSPVSNVDDDESNSRLIVYVPLHDGGVGGSGDDNNSNSFSHHHLQHGRGQQSVSRQWHNLNGGTGSSLVTTSSTNSSRNHNQSGDNSNCSSSLPSPVLTSQNSATGTSCSAAAVGAPEDAVMSSSNNAIGFMPISEHSSSMPPAGVDFGSPSEYSSVSNHGGGGEPSDSGIDSHSFSAGCYDELDEQSCSQHSNALFLENISSGLAGAVCTTGTGLGGSGGGGEPPQHDFTDSLTSPLGPSGPTSAGCNYHPWTNSLMCSLQQQPTTCFSSS